MKSEHYVLAALYMPIALCFALHRPRNSTLVDDGCILDHTPHNWCLPLSGLP